MLRQICDEAEGSPGEKIVKKWTNNIGNALRGDPYFRIYHETYLYEKAVDELWLARHQEVGL